MRSGRSSDRDNQLWSRRAVFKAGASFLGAALLPSFLCRERTLANPAGELELPDLTFGSAGEAARAIRRREVSSLELTDFILERIEKYNPRINAIVAPLFEQAQKRAREADEALARGQTWGPLHGVPVTVKESYDVAGVPSTWGNSEYADNVPQVDATVVTRLRRAGAVLLGKTNVPFMLADWQAFNEVYGITRNPWDLERTPGGSTGGGAAALAAGLSYLSVGGDLGGSIRVPAHFCGVFGHKPSRNVVPGKGHAPPLGKGSLSSGALPVPLPDLEVKGPLARTAADLKLALEILGGPEGEEATAYQWTLPSPRGVRLADYRIGYVLDHPHAPVAPEVKELLSGLINALRRAGARLEEGWPQEADPVKQRDSYLYLLEEWIPMDMNGDGVGTWEASHADVQAALGYQLAARAIWRDFFHTHDAFLLPPFPIAAFPHDHSGTPIHQRLVSAPDRPRSMADMMLWTASANFLGLPATIAPVGLTPSRLPVGIQILGPYLEDATSIALAGHVAEVTGGFRPPDGYQG